MSIIYDGTAYPTCQSYIFSAVLQAEIFLYQNFGFSYSLLQSTSYLSSKKRKRSTLFLCFVSLLSYSSKTYYCWTACGQIPIATSNGKTNRLLLIRPIRRIAVLRTFFVDGRCRSPAGFEIATFYTKP